MSEVSNEKYHHGHLREALIDEAFKQIEQEGAIALNLSKLAQKIGVSQPAVYRHFPSKQALAISVAQRGFEQFAEALQQATQPVQGDVFEGIKAIASAYVTFALNHTEIARLMFSLKERVSDPALYSASKSAAVPLFSIVEAAKRQESLRNQDVDKTVRIIWAALHGLAMLLIDEQMPFVTQSPSELSAHIEETARSLHLGLFIEVKHN
jgi:AcrR family transcriptional regulator